MREGEGPAKDRRRPGYSDVRSLLRFENDYRGWCRQGGIAPSRSLARAWREVRNMLWLTLRLQSGAMSVRGHRVREWVLRRGRTQDGMEDGPVERVYVRVVRDEEGEKLLETHGLVQAVRPLSEATVRARLSPCSLSPEEWDALASVIRGLVAVQDRTLFMCRTCQRAWGIQRRGRGRPFKDCAQCRRHLPAYQRTRQWKRREPDVLARRSRLTSNRPSPHSSRAFGLAWRDRHPPGDVGQSTTSSSLSRPASPLIF
jgi:hypothetical protein